MKVIVLSIFCVLILLCPLPVSAKSFHDVEITGEYIIPENFDFQISDSCSGHNSFLYVSGREDGWYAVCSQYTDAEKDWDSVYRLHYVDIFDSDGNFVQEISYFSEFGNAIEFTETSLNIYFRNAVVSYDFASGALIGYSFPIESTINNEWFSELQANKIYAGQWTYSCIGGLNSHTKLVRSNGEETQVLLDYSGSNRHAWNKDIGIYTISTMITGALIVLYLNFYKKRT